MTSRQIPLPEVPRAKPQDQTGSEEPNEKVGTERAAPPRAAPTGASPSPSALPSVGEDELLAQLNERQREAVTLPPGPALVLAGPGSGKTRVLTHRAAWLVGVRGVPPWRVLAVTFTNKAAREMRERIELLLGASALDRLTIGTFHATCAGILRREAGDPAAGLNFGRSFVIFDSDDQRRVVKRAVDELDIDDKQYRPRAIHGAISDWKNEMLRPGEVHPPTYWHEIALRVYRRYEEILATSNALDFDDLLMECAFLLRDRPEVRDRYRERWPHVLVDEFQDTNTVQYALLKTLTAAEDRDATRDLFVVGDEDQSIYRWRGADFRNIERFRRDFPDAREVLLEQNYRSTQRILDAAQAVIAANRHRTPKTLWTESGPGSAITLFEAYDEAEEAAYVVRRMEQMVRRGRSFGDFAVAYRTNAQSRAIEDALVQRGIPYQLVGATRFYDRREIRDAVAWLRLAHNPLDEVALLRVINVPPRGIGPKALATMQEIAAHLGIPLWDALQRIADERLEPDDLPGDDTEVDTRTHNALTRFHDIVAELLAAREERPPAELLDLAMQASEYRDWLRDGTEEGEGRWENVLELRGVADQYATSRPREGLAAMLESIALVADIDALEEATERVTLLTLHAAKGLEFPVVFITGIEENVLPHSRSTDDPEALEEERRLFYVGITRAREKLILIHAFRRTVFGSSEVRDPSRFLSDLPDEVLGEGSTGGRRGTSHHREVTWETTKGGGGAAPTDPRFSPGDKVLHQTFGRGTVVQSVVRDGDEEVTVAFDGRGVKKLMQSFAKLEEA